VLITEGKTNSLTVLVECRYESLVPVDTISREVQIIA
jgi:hypothetical protein